MPTSFHSDDLSSQSCSPSQSEECINSTESHFDQHEINHYHLTFYFEVAVECVNSLAGLLVLLAVCLAGVNLAIVAINSVSGSDYRLFDHMHSNGKATILRIRLMLGEQTALALALLVAADVLDTVMKPSHAFEMNDVIKMGFLTVLRTGVAYFLAREIKELELGGGHSYDGSSDKLMDDDYDYRQQSLSFSSKKCRRLLQRSDSVDSVNMRPSSPRWNEGTERSGMKFHRKDSDVTTNSNNSSNAEDSESLSSNLEESVSDEKAETMDQDGQGSSDQSSSCRPSFSEHSPRREGRSPRAKSTERNRKQPNKFVEDANGSINNFSSERKKPLKEE